MNDFLIVIVCIAIWGVGFIIGLVNGFDHQYDKIWREAVSRGVAEYCPKDGTFAWNGECNE